MPPSSAIYTFVSISFGGSLSNLLTAGQSHHQHGADQEHLKRCLPSLPDFSLLLSLFVNSSPTPVDLIFFFTILLPR